MVWDFAPEIFCVSMFGMGDYCPRWYGLTFASGILLGYFIMQKFFNEAGRSEDDLNNGFVLFVIGTIAGARLGHCLFYDPGYYLSHPLEILMLHKGGLASHGGTIGIVLCMIYYTRKYKISFSWLADRLGLACAVGVPFIRIGNFLNSEIVGRPADVPWAVTFVRYDKMMGITPIPRHPAQLYEALSYFAVFFILAGYYKLSKGIFPRGRIIGMMFVGIFAARFFIEFFKENQEAFEEGLVLNMGQILSIPMVALGVFLIFGGYELVATYFEPPAEAPTGAGKTGKKRLKRK